MSRNLRGRVKSDKSKVAANQNQDIIINSEEEFDTEREETLVTAGKISGDETEKSETVIIKGGSILRPSRESPMGELITTQRNLVGIASGGEAGS